MAESKHLLPRVTFRFPDDLRKRLEKAAQANVRSVNAEVVARLEASFKADEFEKLSVVEQFRAKLAAVTADVEKIKTALGNEPEPPKNPTP